MVRASGTKTKRAALALPPSAVITKKIMLPADLTDAEMERGCQLAVEYGVASVCIKPYAVKTAAKLLAGSGVFTSTVIGFPHGGHLTKTKVYEANAAIDDGAVELDMVVNIGKVLTGDWSYVAADVKAVVDAAHARAAKVKVIFEKCFLKDEHKIRLCQICGELNADFVQCRAGRRELVRTEYDGRRTVLEVKPLD